jgi:hypothetical protein
MRTFFGLFTVGVVAGGLSLMAQEGAKQEMKDAGTDIKQGAKNTGNAAKHAGKGVAKGAKKGVHKAAGATENGANKVKEKTQ